VLSLPWVSGATALAFDMRGEYLAVGYLDKSVSVWEVSAQNEIRHFALGAPVSAVCWSPDGRFIVAGGMNGRWKAWDVKSDTVVNDEFLRGRIWCAVFSADGAHLALGGVTGSLIRKGLHGPSMVTSLGLV
jgi:WD40 repeat protein